jgi:3-octaprenyl-4-hydroxybenzoate carboxy-lyase
LPYQDFRQFLDVLRQHGELIDVNRPVALNDVGKAMKQSYVRQGPAIMFNQNGTDYPLVAGVYSTRSKALLAFEAAQSPECYSLRQLLANAAIAASRVGSYPSAARLMSPLWPLAHIQGLFGGAEPEEFQYYLVLSRCSNLCGNAWASKAFRVHRRRRG